jgi:hypothetical protein
MGLTEYNTGLKLKGDAKRVPKRQGRLLIPLFPLLVILSISHLSPPFKIHLLHSIKNTIYV